MVASSVLRATCFVFLQGALITHRFFSRSRPLGLFAIFFRGSVGRSSPRRLFFMTYRGQISFETKCKKLRYVVLACLEFLFGRATQKDQRTSQMSCSHREIREFESAYNTRREFLLLLLHHKSFLTCQAEFNMQPTYIYNNEYDQEMKWRTKFSSIIPILLGLLQFLLTLAIIGLEIASVIISPIFGTLYAGFWLSFFFILSWIAMFVLGRRQITRRHLLVSFLSSLLSSLTQICLSRLCHIAPVCSCCDSPDRPRCLVHCQHNTMLLRQVGVH